MKVTPRDRDVLTFIETYISERKYPPSYREIGDACGMRSKSSVHNHVRRLLKEGFLETDKDNEGCPRAYRIAKKEH